MHDFNDYESHIDKVFGSFGIKPNSGNKGNKKDSEPRSEEPSFSFGDSAFPDIFDGAITDALKGHALLDRMLADAKGIEFVPVNDSDEFDPEDIRGQLQANFSNSDPAAWEQRIQELRQHADELQQRLGLE